MTNTPNSQRRRCAILKVALEVFAELGYNEVTLQKVADRCNLTRTTLYVYFRNKEDIFTYSIRYKTSQIEDTLKAIASDNSLTADKKLEKAMYTLFDILDEGKKLLQVLLVYLLEAGRKGSNTHRIVKRNIIKLRHILSGITISGIKKGEIANCNVKCINEVAMSIVEGLALQLALGGNIDIAKAKFVISRMMEKIKIQKDS